MVAVAAVPGSKPQMMRDEHGDEWWVVDNVPILDEHIDEEGTRYDAQLLQAIANNNNQRIIDTGDECPIVMHHTPTDGDPRKDPEVVGYADNFRVQRFGKTKPRAAIYCRFKIIPSKREKIKYRNRRSVEIWPETSPEKRYIDPIALLGSETPRRDLGIIRYSNRARFRYHKRGEYCFRYEMPTAPGATNTYLPGEKNRYQQADTLPLAGNPALMSQLAEGLKPLIEQMIEERLADTIGGDLTPVNVPDGGDDMATDAMDMNEIMDPGMDAGMDPGMDPGMDAPPADPGMDAGGPAADPLAGALGDEDKQYAKQLYRRKVYGKGQDFEAARQAFDGLGDDDKDLVSRYMKDCDDSDMASHYAKCCGDDTQDIDDKERYSKRYAKLETENTQLRIQYRKAQQQVQRLQKDLADVRKESRRLRYQKRLIEKQMEGYIFDLEEETDRVCGMGDAQADSYIDDVVPRFDRAPIDNVPLERMMEQPSQYAKITQDRKTEKDRSDKAAKVVMQYRKSHPNLSFAQVYKYMLEHDTDEFPEDQLTAKSQ